MNPAAFTLPVAVIRIPLGLTRNTRPLAVICPAISLVVLPVTRLSSADVAPGWLMSTRPPAPTEKLCQLMIARSLVWVICIAPAEGFAMVAAPA